jgi:hypothetical protein
MDQRQPLPLILGVVTSGRCVLTDLAVPTVRQEGDVYVFVWDGLNVELEMRDIATGRDGPRAEVWARDRTLGHLYGGMVTLLSTSSKQTFTKAVVGRDESTNWALLIEQASMIAVQKFRDGEPFELLEPQRRPAAGSYAVRPLAPAGQPTLWYGDGKAAKSYVLVASLRAMTLGEPLAHMAVPQRFTPAYLDWEWDKDEHADRLLRLGGDVTFLYRHCSAPLAEQAKAIRRELDRNGIEIIAIDSLGLACGGDPKEPDIALRFFAAIRHLGRTAIIIHHTPKGSRDPFGSAYIRNSARSGWLFTAQQRADEPVTKVALRHRWTNSGRLQPDFGLTLTFDDDAYTTRIQSSDPKDVTVGGLRTRILELLEPSSGMTITEICDALPDEDRGNIKSQLTQMHKAKTPKVMNDDGRWLTV